MRSRARSPLAVSIAAGLIATASMVGPVAAQSPSAPASGGSPAASAVPSAAAPSPAASPASPSPIASVDPATAVDPRLAAAVEATVGSGTVRTTYSVVFDGSTMIPDGTRIDGEGQTTLGLDRQMRLSMDATALGVGAFELIVDGTMLYLRGLPIGDISADQWISADLTRDDPMTASLAALASGNNDASLLLYFLLGATAPAEVLSEETIDGISTTHLAATLDLDRALALVPDEIRPVLEANIEEVRAGGVEPVLDAQVWVDADDLVHRLVLDYTLGDAMGGGGMTVTFDFRRHGEPLELDIPAPEETVDIATLGS